MKCGAPMMINNPDFKGTDKMLPVRCGKCEGCLKSNINNWAFRLEQEAKNSLYVHFVTLTYDPQFVPLTDTQLHTLNKKDVQLYIKRIRKIHGRGIKYFAVGEYGSRSYRPHYHIIFFNVPKRETIYSQWSRGKLPIGNVHIGSSIDSGAIPYTLKYMYKKGLVPAFPEDDRLKEFRIMSKTLGINYLSPEIIRWHLTDFPNRQYVMFANGIKVALPRYFREILIKKWGKPRHLLRVEENLYPLEDDGHYLTVKSRMEAQKYREKRFEKQRNQNERNKI